MRSLLRATSVVSAGVHYVVDSNPGNTQGVRLLWAGKGRAWGDGNWRK